MVNVPPSVCRLIARPFLCSPVHAHVVRRPVPLGLCPSRVPPCSASLCGWRGCVDRMVEFVFLLVGSCPLFECSLSPHMVSLSSFSSLHTVANRNCSWNTHLDPMPDHIAKSARRTVSAMFVSNRGDTENYGSPASVSLS